MHVCPLFNQIACHVRMACNMWKMSDLRLDAIHVLCRFHQQHPQSLISLYLELINKPMETGWQLAGASSGPQGIKNFKN
jgi:hypothetical protein